MFPSPQQRITPNVFCFLYANGRSWSWKLFHYQLCESTWARRQRDWIPNNCLARKVEKDCGGELGDVQPLKGIEHLDEHTRRVLSLCYWMSQIVLGEHQDVLSRPGGLGAPLLGGRRMHSSIKCRCCWSRHLVCAGYPFLPSKGQHEGNSSSQLAPLMKLEWVGFLPLCRKTTCFSNLFICTLWGDGFTLRHSRAQGSGGLVQIVLSLCKKQCVLVVRVPYFKYTASLWWQRYMLLCVVKLLWYLKATDH